MAFPDSWQRKCAIVIQAAQVAETLTDFPMLVTGDNLPAEIWANADDGGGDLRFSADDAGSVRLACEIVSFSTSGETAEIYVKVPSVSSAVNTTIYIWYNNTGQTQPAATDTYGSQAVWGSDYAAVYHFNQNPAGGTLLDSTANGNNGTPAGGMDASDLVDGQIGAGSAWNFDGINNYVTFPAALNMFFNNTNFTILNIVKTADIQFRLFQTRGTGSFSTERGIQMSVTTADFLNTVISDGLGNYISHQSLPIDNFLNDTWRFLSFDFNNTTGQSKLNFDKTAENSLINSSLIGGNFTGIGAEFGRSNQGTQYFDGQSAELRILSSVFTKNLKDTFYNNLFFPANFAIAGTPTATQLFNPAWAKHSNQIIRAL